MALFASSSLRIVIAVNLYLRGIDSDIILVNPDSSSGVRANRSRVVQCLHSMAVGSTLRVECFEEQYRVRFTTMLQKHDYFSCSFRRVDVVSVLTEMPERSLLCSDGSARYLYTISACRQRLGTHETAENIDC